jgi:hypothetical protein
MEIIAVGPIMLQAPIAPVVRVRQSFGMMTERYSTLVGIDTDAGISRSGESWSNFLVSSRHERVHAIREGLAPLGCVDMRLLCLKCQQNLVLEQVLS